MEGPNDSGNEAQRAKMRPSFKAIKGAPRPYSPGLGVWGSGAVGPKGPLDRRVCSMRRRGVVVSALVGFG